MKKEQSQSKEDIIHHREPPNYLWGNRSQYNKSEYACAECIRHLCGAFCNSRRYEDHFDYIAVMTLTFKDQIDSSREAKQILDRITKTLKRRYSKRLYRPGHDFSYIVTQERHKTGAIHFHYVLEMPFNIRQGSQIDMLYDWDFIQRSGTVRDRVKDSLQFLNAGLQKENVELSEVLSKYGVGRFDLWPICTDANSVSDYISKAVSRHVNYRHPEDKGARLWSCSKNVRCVKSNFSYREGKAAEFRKKLSLWARLNSCNNLEDVERVFGRYWYMSNRNLINRVELDFDVDAFLEANPGWFRGDYCGPLDELRGQPIDEICFINVADKDKQ